ncbi:hypothetical protein [Microbacterium sp. EST19A]|uniref:hypothetical protein n=1 Tax=Microbacterium sp. EST19A TaxID=2862681 RepID=UPI001CC0D257|nr:hypothetical protein [Microbacterium sp. EST19A]
MFEHPYLSQQITTFEQQQIERAAEQRRFLSEHADQIVPRREGAFRRMLRRMAGSGREAASTTRTTAPRTVDDRATAGCDRAAAPAQ